MKLPHTILSDAIQFTLTKMEVKHWLKARNGNPQQTINEIKSFIKDFSDDVCIHVVIKYNPLNNWEDVDKIIVELKWSHLSGFTVSGLTTPDATKKELRPDIYFS
ncbi:MAG TPA: hypothetical protein PKK00_05085 [Bacteroidales bacterium]|nr:hypothetical protein [Bacteroidales bacterium]HPS16733.1 hypothetical protein [Bacteroidales bacterium]